MDLETEYRKAHRKAYQAKRDWLADALEKEVSKSLSRIDTRIPDEVYRREILPYWERYGLRPKKLWFDYYCARDGRIDPQMTPADLYYLDILPYLNNLQFPGIMDKCYLDRALPEVRQIKPLVKRIAGEFYDGDMNLISEREALNLCLSSRENLFIKPSVYTCYGRGITRVGKEEKTKDHLKEILGSTGNNLVIQEELRQHPALSDLCPDTVNTIRVGSLFIEGKVNITMTTLRIGAPGTDHVSDHPDNKYTEVLPDGRLHHRYHDLNLRWYDCKETGLYAPDFRIPSLDKVYDTVRVAHPLLSHYKEIGWDFTIDPQGEPVMIEINLRPDLCFQFTRGKPLLGEMTQWVYDDFFIHRSLEKNQQQGLIVQI